MHTLANRFRVLAPVLVAISLIVASATFAAEATTQPIRFAVLGDRTGDHQPGLYGKAVEEVNRLRPEFVMTVGDMIEGYTEDSTILKEEWEEYLALLEPLSVPVYHVPGNHDITSDPLEAFYERYIGVDANYSFDHRGVHITIFDNSRWESSEELPQEKIDWLIDDLQKNNGADYNLVFMHKPFWYNTTALGEPDTLHSVFTAFGVDGVFTGHYHRYFSGEYDDISYTSIGASGARLPDNQFGLMQHFAWVTVDADGIHIAPILVGSVAAWDDKTADDVRFADDVNRLALAFRSAAPVSENLAVAQTEVSALVRNLSPDKTLTDTLRWEIPDNWRVTPPNLPVEIAPNDSLSVQFTVSAHGSLYPVPSLSLDVTFGDDETIEVTNSLHIAREIACQSVQSAPTIDGRLDESLWRFPVTDLFSPSGEVSDIDSTEFYWAFDEDNLYLAARCFDRVIDSLRAATVERDGAVFGEDCVGYFFQPDPANRFVYQIYINPLGAVFDQTIDFNTTTGWYTTEREFDGEYEVATDKTESYWSMEMRIPLGELGATLGESSEWRLNFRRKQKRYNSAGNWQTPIDYDPRTFGVLRFE